MNQMQNAATGDPRLLANLEYNLGPVVMDTRQFLILVFFLYKILLTYYFADFCFAAFTGSLV